MSLIKVRNYAHRNGAHAYVDPARRNGAHAYVDPKAIVGLHAIWTEKSDYGNAIYQVIVLFNSGSQLNLELNQVDLEKIEKAI